MQDNVVPMNVTKPKTTRETYKGHNITITYNLDTTKWEWKFNVPYMYSGEARTYKTALSAAKKRIDAIT